MHQLVAIFPRQTPVRQREFEGIQHRIDIILKRAIPNLGSIQALPAVAVAKAALDVRDDRHDLIGVVWYTIT